MCGPEANQDHIILVGRGWQSLGSFKGLTKYSICNLSAMRACYNLCNSLSLKINPGYITIRVEPNAARFTVGQQLLVESSLHFKQQQFTTAVTSFISVPCKYSYVKFLYILNKLPKKTLAF